MFSSGTVLCWLAEEVDMGKVKFLFLLFPCNYSQLRTHLGVLQPLNWILEISSLYFGTVYNLTEDLIFCPAHLASFVRILFFSAFSRITSQKH